MIFHFGPDVVLIKVEGNNVKFGNTSYGAQLTSIDGLKLSKAGVIKEFPELKDSPLWKEEAIFRFKKHIKRLNTERAKAKYISEDLKKHGYVLKKVQQAGQRPRAYL